MSVARETIVDLLGRGITVRFQADGDSMYPQIRAGDHVVIAPARIDDLRRGEIVLTLTARGLTVHRVTGVAAGGITTRGDNAPSADPPVAAGEILGRVISIERNGHRQRVRGIAIASVIRALRRLRRAVGPRS